MCEGTHCAIEASVENDFMPLAADIAPHISGAALLCLCSPQNPTGTTFSEKELAKICDLVIEENKKRGENSKKLFVLYDQMYWTLTFGETRHFNPVGLRPEMKPYTLFVDGISKAFAATGVRVGWTLAPSFIIDKMKAILSHLGAWAPMAEQKATAKFLIDKQKIEEYLTYFKAAVEERLKRIYEGMISLKNEGFNIDAVPPQAAIYLTVKFDLTGKTNKSGEVLEKQSDVTDYLLSEGKLAVVPFYAFGGERESAWYRLSVGTCKTEEIDVMFEKLREALKKLE
jgi:aspartate aminotransferase